MSPQESIDLITKNNIHKLKITALDIEGLFIVEPKVFADERGYFMESFKKNELHEKLHLTSEFIQDNESFSKRGTLRGLHLQLPPYDQAKLVRVIQGEVFDVAVDLRPNSSTFGKHHSLILSAENKKQFYIPRGFAHGFLVTSDTAIFTYKVDNVYNKESESGILFSDQEIKIEWPKIGSEFIISEKDKVLPNFKEFAEANKKQILNFK